MLSETKIRCYSGIDTLWKEFTQFALENSNEKLWSPLGTIPYRKRDITKFLHYLDSHGIASVKDIQASKLYPQPAF